MAEKEKLENVLKDLTKKFEVGEIKIGVEFTERERIPFSSPRLNYMTYGGIPIGLFTELSGDEGSGKTTTALDLIANAQKKFPDRQVAICDVEHTFDSEWAVKNGVNIDELIYYDPGAQSAEEIFNTLIRLANTGSVSLIVLDSIGQMISDMANQKQIGERTYGGISLPLTEFCKKMSAVCSREKVAFVGINQMRADLNSQWGGETTTGGKAWLHNCSLRLQFRKGSYIDDAGKEISRSCENPAGNIVNVAILKSKICMLDRKVGFYTLNYLNGIDYISDIVEVGIKVGVVDKSGAWFSILDESGEVAELDEKQLKFQGKAKICDFLSNNKEYCDTLTSRIEELM